MCHVHGYGATRAWRLHACGFASGTGFWLGRRERVRPAQGQRRHGKLSPSFHPAAALCDAVLVWRLQVAVESAAASGAASRGTPRRVLALGARPEVPFFAGVHAQNGTDTRMMCRRVVGMARGSSGRGLRTCRTMAAVGPCDRTTAWAHSAGPPATPAAQIDRAAPTAERAAPAASGRRGPAQTTAATCRGAA